MHWTDAGDGRPRRHARVWLDRRTWRDAVAGPLDAVTTDALDRWIGAGRALVARRRDASDGACRVALGVALPDRTRVGIVVDGPAVVRVEPPLTLAAVVDPAPPDWRAALRDLDARGAAAGVRFHVYGSLAWQAMTGERYVTASSDVDLLWTAEPGGIDAALRLLTDWEASSGRRADGEYLLTSGGGVAWRELSNGPRRVMVKHQDRVSLEPPPLGAAVRHSAAATIARTTRSR